MYSREKAVILGSKNMKMYIDESIEYFTQIMSEVKETYHYSCDVREQFVRRVQQKVEIVLRELSQKRLQDNEIEELKRSWAFLTTASEYLKAFGTLSDIQFAKKLNDVGDAIQSCIADTAFKLAMA